MKKLFYAFIALLAIVSTPNNSYAQKEIEEKIVCSDTPDKLPSYKDGDINHFVSRIKSDLKAPQECLDYEINGKITLSFVVTKRGTIKNVKADKSPFHSLVVSVQKMIEGSEKWSPAEKDGKKVNYKFNITIPFSFVKDKNNTGAMFNGVNVKGFQKYIQSKIKIPNEAMVERSEGAITVRFTVEADGRLTNFVALESSSDLLTDNLVKTIKTEGKWTPAQKDGKNVSQEVVVTAIYTLPLKLDQEPSLRNLDFSYLLDHDSLLDLIKYSTMRGYDTEFDWYIYSDGRCEIRNTFSSSLQSIYRLQSRFEHQNWRAGKYGGKDVSVRYHITVRGGFITYDTYILK